MATSNLGLFPRRGIGAIHVLLASAMALISGCGGGSGGEDPATPTTASGIVTALQSSTQRAKSPEAPSSSASPAAPSTTAIVVRASAGLHQGVGSKVNLRYNGVTLASFEVNKGTVADYRFETTTAIDGGLLDLVFLNAADGQGNQVRYLKIESLTVAAATFLPTDTLVSFDRGDGPAALDGDDVRPGLTTLISNGALRLIVPAVLQQSAADQAKVAIASPAGYYVDARGGDDTNPGTSEKPWRSLARLAVVKLKDGEGIYLRCGSLWRETLSLSAQQLPNGSTVAGYGPECGLRKAMIAGADDFSTGWQRSGNIWSRSLPTGTPKVTQLFVDGQPMHTAQWPDTASGNRPAPARAAATASDRELTLQTADATLLAGMDLIGATAQLRTQQWTIETRRVTGYASGKFQVDRVSDWALASDTAFLLQDKLWMLNAPGEFFHDTATQRLYVIAPAVGAPDDLNTALIEGSVRDTGLMVTQSSGVVVRDVAVRHTRADGMRLINAPQAQLVRIEANDNVQSGVSLQQWPPLAANAPGPSIIDSTTAGNGLYGIDALFVTSAVISHNRILGTGVGPQQQSNVMAAISTGPGGRIEDNKIDGAAYIGIRFDGRNGSVVARNTISNYCTRLTDCGAIYTWQGRTDPTLPQSATVTANRVLGAASDSSAPVAGVYVDDMSRNIVVSNNVLTGMPFGIFVHNASNITIDSNRIWLATTAALCGVMDQSDADWMTGNSWSNNFIVPLVQAQATAGGLPSFTTSQAVWFEHALDAEAALAAGRNTFSGNTVVQLQGPLAAHAWLRGRGAERYVDALQWQSLNPSEPLPLRPARFAPVTVSVGPELALGGGFDSGLGAWGSYNNSAASGFALTPLAAAPGCQGPCVRMTAGDPYDLLGSAPFSLRAGVPYVYRWDAVMPAAGQATIGDPYISRSASPWDRMYDTRGFKSYGPLHGGNGETLSYEAFFVAKESASAQAFLQLSTVRVPVALDNISVREVTGFVISQKTDWAAVAFAPASGARTIGCTELGWPDGCTAIAADGSPVALPLQLAAGTERLLLRADSPFKR